MPKPVQESEEIIQKTNGIIENVPECLAEGIIRASDTLEDPEIELDLRSKFELFEGLNRKEIVLDKEERTAKR
jgi:hypothetical protein